VSNLRQRLRSLARFGKTARRLTVQLLALACLMLPISDRPTSAVQPVSGSSQRVVTAEAMTAFLQTLAQRKPNEYLDVLRDAQRRFPRGTVLESFPESVFEHLPKQQPRPLRLVKAQVEKDGLDTKDLKAVTIFKGDNGMVQVDIIVVLSRGRNAVAGCYGALWGR
jgi:hypothetical protein